MKSISRTFRFDEDLLTTMRGLSARRNISVNQLVADSIRKAAADALMEGIEMDEVPSAVMLKFMEYLSPEQVAELGKWSAIHFSRKFAWQIFKELSFDTVIKTYEAMAQKYRHFFSFQHHKENSDHILKIHHSRGQKWSIYYGESMRTTFNDLLGIPIAVEMGLNELTGRFTEPSHMVRTKQVLQNY